MDVIIKALIFTAGQALAFHVVLPAWYVLIQLSKGIQTDPDGNEMQTE